MSKKEDVKLEQVKESLEGADPELQLLKYKRKCGVVLDVLKARAQKEDVEDYMTTIESVIPILNRMLTQVHNMEKKDLATIILKLQDTLDDYERYLLELEKSGKLKRFLTNNRLRKKLDKLNSRLHKDIEFFVEIIIQVEVLQSEKQSEKEEERKKADRLSTSLVQSRSPSQSPILQHSLSSSARSSSNVNQPRMESGTTNK